MNLPFTGFIRGIDRYCLLNHPLIWIMHAPWIVRSWLLGLIIICLCATLAPIGLTTIYIALPLYSALVLIFLFVHLMSWTERQSRLAPWLSQSSKSTALLMVSYLLILMVHLAWPYAFAAIIKNRIDSAVHISVAELKTDLLSMSLSSEAEDAESKYRRFDLPEFIPVMFDARNVINIILWAKGVHPVSPFLYYGIPMAIIVILAPILNSSVHKGLGGMIFLVIPFGGIPFALLALFALISPAVAAISAYSFLLFSGILMTLRKNVNGPGVDFLSIALPWLPLVLYLAFWGISSRAISFPLFSGLLALGVVMLLAATPWLQSRYRTAALRPSQR